MKIRLISLLLLLTASFTVAGQRVTPYKGSRIFWDVNSQVTVFQRGNYARMIELQDGRLLAVAEAQGGISITFSSNKGSSWTPPQLIATPPDKVFLAVPDVIQLTDGTLVIGYNPRPRSPYTTDRLFGIRVVKSTDNGQSWSEPYYVFDARHTFNDGCWEPAFLELPSGELQCYFANENEYTTSNDQNISMCRSFDKGQTWSDPVTICYRQGSRDGMPVPLLLKDKSEIVVIIEDNGWPGRGNFAATTVRTTLADNWSTGPVTARSENRSMIFETIPPTSIYSAAPYIRMLPGGETVASFQSNEKRSSGDLQYADMYVVAGDERARNFKAKSAPFALGHDKHAIWNSVSVIDTGIVVALASIGVPNGHNDVVMLKGYPLRGATAAFGSITVDGVKSSDEKWTTPGVSQLHMGHQLKNKVSVDFLYDADNLYITARVIDRNIINTGVDNDGVRFSIDAGDVSAATPQEGMYSFWFDTDGSVKMQRAATGAWKNAETTTEIRYSVDVKSLYYTFEAAIPWTVLGKTAAPVNERMAIAVEIKNKEQYTLTTEGIADVDPNASWTWLEFRLGAPGISGIRGPGAKGTNIKTRMDHNVLHVMSPVAVREFSFIGFDGKVLASETASGVNFQVPLPLQGRGIAQFILEDGSVVNKKILY